MYCTQCSCELTQCVCPSFAERIADLEKSPYLAMPWGAIRSANNEHRLRIGLKPIDYSKPVEANKL